MAGYWHLCSYWLFSLLWWNQKMRYQSGANDDIQWIPQPNWPSCRCYSRRTSWLALPNWLWRLLPPFGCNTQLTVAEWALLQEGLLLLHQINLESIHKSIAPLKEQSARHIVCPMLNQETGTCRVYPYRPTACRTYGFYVQRDKGLYCKEIETQVNSGRLDNVLWGNQDAIEELLNLKKSVGRKETRSC